MCMYEVCVHICIYLFLLLLLVADRLYTLSAKSSAVEKNTSIGTTMVYFSLRALIFAPGTSESLCGTVAKNMIVR